MGVPAVVAASCVNGTVALVSTSLTSWIKVIQEIKSQFLHMLPPSLRLRKKPVDNLTYMEVVENPALIHPHQGAVHSIYPCTTT